MCRLNKNKNFRELNSQQQQLCQKTLRSIQQKIKNHNFITSKADEDNFGKKTEHINKVVSRLINNNFKHLTRNLFNKFLRILKV